MESFDEITAFVRVVDAGSFAAAAQTLGVTPSAMSRAITRLEERLGARLLHRTTRSLNLTDAGRAYYHRCVDLLNRLAEADCEIACMLGRPAGRLRVGMPVAIARRLIAPALPGFLDRYPDLQVHVSGSDRVVDLVEEGLDVALRVGDLSDSSLQARRLGSMQLCVVASPAFIEQHGVPRTPDELDPRHCLGTINMNTGQIRSWIFGKGGLERRIDPTARLAFTDAEAQMIAAVSGAGYARFFRHMVRQELADGQLREVLTDWDSGSRIISAIYARDRNPIAKVRVFIDFAAELFRNIEKRPTLKVVHQGAGVRRATSGASASQPAPKAL